MIHKIFGPTLSTPKVSLIISFYNKIDFFRLVYASLEKQSFQDFEILIADDGSKPEVTRELHTMLEVGSISAQHLWHEDIGWRKNRILNQCIKAARAEYIIFIDGDCVLHPDFIADHWHNRVPGCSLAGRRLDLSPSLTKNLTPEKIHSGYIQKNLWRIIPAISWRKDNNGAKGIRLQSPLLQKLFNRKDRGIVGCNFSLFKSDLERVNGFDMRYEGPGIGEDSDIEFRLNLAGIRTLPFCHLGIQYHLYHRLLDRRSLNEELFRTVLAEKKSWAPQGLKEVSGS